MNTPNLPPRGYGETGWGADDIRAFYTEGYTEGYNTCSLRVNELWVLLMAAEQALSNVHYHMDWESQHRYDQRMEVLTAIRAEIKSVQAKIDNQSPPSGG